MYLINRLLISFSCILNGNYPLSWIFIEVYHVTSDERKGEEEGMNNPIFHLSQESEAY